MMREISGRYDIEVLVDQFYDRIRKEKVLGPIFNQHIAEEEWPSHLRKLADFWETNLFGIPKFKGNPTQKHIDVDASLNYTIEPKHFGIWLQVWYETIDSLFIGEVADKAKNAARRMSTVQYLAMWKSRPNNNL